MTERILEEFEHDISELIIQPSGGGVFEVTVDGELLFSKKSAKRHAEAGEVLSTMREKASR